MRLAFMGTPDFALPALEAIHAAGHEIACVYCQPPRPAGRGHREMPSPVHARALSLGLVVRHPASLRGEEEQTAFAALGLDIAVVAAYGLILPRPILEAPRLGCINIHASLLPRWRGAAPIQRAILAGDAATGITIMQMEAGLDTGPILLQEAVPIGPETTASALHDTLAGMGARLVLTALARLEAGALATTPQQADGVTYAAKLDREEGRLDWRLPAEVLDRCVRALNPWPGTWFVYEGERIKLLAAHWSPQAGVAAAPGTVLDDGLAIACGSGTLQPLILQRQGRQALPLAEFLRGMPVVPGTVLECPVTS